MQIDTEIKKHLIGVYSEYFDPLYYELDYLSAIKIFLINIALHGNSIFL